MNKTLREISQEEFDDLAKSHRECKKRLTLTKVDVSKIELKNPEYFISFIDCELGELDFSGLKLINSQFLRCTFKAPPSFKRCDLRYANFEGMQFPEGTNFNYAKLQQAIFKDAGLRGVSMRYSNLNHADFKGADLTGADLSGVKLSEAQIRESRSENAT